MNVTGWQIKQSVQACHSSQRSFYSPSKVMRVCSSFVDRLRSACSDSVLCSEGANCFSDSGLCRNAADVIEERFQAAWEVIDGSHPNCYDPNQRSNSAGLFDGVIGGIVGLVVLIGIGFYCYRSADSPVKDADTFVPPEVNREYDSEIVWSAACVIHIN